MKSLNILASIAILTTLTACGGSNVKLVKNYTFNALKSMPVGTAIDGSPLCKKVQWKDESTKEQKFVTAACFMNDELVKEYFDDGDKQYKKLVESMEENKTRALEELGQKYKKMASENTPEFNQDKLIAASKNICKVEKEDEVKCDLEAYRKEFSLKADEKGWTGYKLNSLDERYLNDLFNAANSNDNQVCGSYGFSSRKCMDKPKMPQELQTKITFVINTDKTVDVFKGEIIDDGKVVMAEDNQKRTAGRQEIRDALNGRFLEKFYERK